jgi:aminoglycoside phosphotransferase (APT) family kinase protein
MKEASDEEIRQREASVLKIATRWFGAPNQIEYKAAGASNFVFAVSYPRQGYVIRMSPDSERINAFRKEKWVIEHVRARNVPAPEVIDVSVEDNCPYMIVRRVDGTEGTHHPERLSTLEELGAYARHIHSIPTHGFGSTFDWSSAEKKNRNWQEFLANELHLDERLALMEKLAILDAGQLGTLRETLRIAVELPGETALMHGDLRLKNVIVNDEGRINAIIDWEHSMSLPPPYWDLAIALHDLSIDGKEAFLRGYDLKDKQMSEVAPFLRALNIINYAPVLEQAEQNGDKEQIEQLRARLNGALDLYGA